MPMPPGINVHSSKAAEKAQNCMRYVDPFLDDVVWAATGEGWTDRTSRVVVAAKYHTGPCAQQSNSVRLAAIWLGGVCLSSPSLGTELHVCWNVLLEANPLFGRCCQSASGVRGGGAVAEKYLGFEKTDHVGAVNYEQPTSGASKGGAGISPRVEGSAGVALKNETEEVENKLEETHPSNLEGNRPQKGTGVGAGGGEGA